MKTAVLISGQLRTFKKCYPTQKWQIFRHYEPDIHFFVSICNDAQAGDVALLQRNYPSVNVSVETYEDPIDLPDIPIQAGAHAPYANAAGHSRLMLQHWGNKKVWDFFCTSAKESFDVIIRIRPDQWIHRFQIQRQPEPHECFSPWWGKFGGINDRLAIMGPLAAEVYFTMFGEIQRMLDRGAPFHPETLMLENLQSRSIHSQSNLMTEFSTMRMDGSQRWAEIVMSDIAELIT